MLVHRDEKISKTLNFFNGGKGRFTWVDFDQTAAHPSWRHKSPAADMTTFLLF